MRDADAHHGGRDDDRARIGASPERAAQLHKNTLRLRLSSTLIALRSEELLLQSQVERYLRGPFDQPVSPRTARSRGPRGIWD